MLFPAVERFFPIRAERRARTYRDACDHRGVPAHVQQQCPVLLYSQENARDQCGWGVQAGQHFLHGAIPAFGSRGVLSLRFFSGTFQASLTKAYIDFTMIITKVGSVTSYIPFNGTDPVFPHTMTHGIIKDGRGRKGK